MVYAIYQQHKIVVIYAATWAILKLKLKKIKSTSRKISNISANGTFFPPPSKKKKKNFLKLSSHQKTFMKLFDIHDKTP